MRPIHLLTLWGGRTKPGWGGGAGIGLALLLLASGAAVSGARELVAGPDGEDRPSFVSPTDVSPTDRPPVLSLQELFHPTYTVPLDPSKIRTLLVTGDVIPARGVNYHATKRRDFLWPFRPTADFTKSADITYIDLESPLFASCPLSLPQSWTFCGDARFVDGLKLMGTRVANLTNNHITNYGTKGLNATVQLLEQHGIQTSGLGPVAVIDVRGIKFGFIGFNGVGHAINKRALKEGIARARQQANIVVVQFHWGKEYERQPMADRRVPTPDDPVTVGHETIDWGADLVIGNHPHWYQGVEVYHGRLIAYAHGNFIFDQMWSEETREGVIGTYTFYDTQLVAASWKAVRIYDYGQPVFMNQTDNAAVIQTMEAASDELASRLHQPTTSPVPAYPPPPKYAPQQAP